MKHIKKFNEGEFLDNLLNAGERPPRLVLRDKINSMLHGGMRDYLLSGGTEAARKFVDFVDRQDPYVRDKTIFQSYGNDGDTMWRTVLEIGRFDIADELIRRAKLGCTYLYPKDTNYIRRGLIPKDNKPEYMNRCLSYLD